MNFSAFYYKENGRQLLVCGGSYGHLNHPYDDDALTFTQLKDMISKCLTNKVDFTEKVDGMQLSVSFKNGKVIFSRNKTQLKNSGENAIDLQGIAQMFSGRGDITDAFVRCSTDLQSGLSKLPTSSLNKWFGEGSKFLSVEIIYKPTMNIIPYKTDMIIPHSLITYDIDGNNIKEDDVTAKAIFDAIDEKNFRYFTKKMPNKLSPISDKSLIDDFTNELDSIKGSLADSDTVGDYKKLNGNVEPLEKLFLRLGIVVLNNSKDFMVSDVEDAVNDIKKRLKDNIRAIEASSDEKRIAKLKKQMDRLDSIGGVDTISPSEGLVFKYNNKKYKLTGSYAPVNAIYNLIGWSD